MCSQKSLTSHPWQHKTQDRLQLVPAGKGDSSYQDLHDEIYDFLKFINPQIYCENKSNIDYIGYNDYCLLNIISCKFMVLLKGKHLFRQLLSYLLYKKKEKILKLFSSRIRVNNQKREHIPFGIHVYTHIRIVYFLSGL